jgi:hypothetical protein
MVSHSPTVIIPFYTGQHWHDFSLMWEGSDWSPADGEQLYGTKFEDCPQPGQWCKLDCRYPPESWMWVTETKSYQNISSSLLPDGLLLGLFFSPEDGDMLVWNVGCLSLDYTVPGDTTIWNSSFVLQVYIRHCIYPKFQFNPYHSVLPVTLFCSFF